MAVILNTPMCKASGKDVDDTIDINIDFDKENRTTPMHKKFKPALNKNKKAKERLNSLPPSRQKEKLRYLNNLKTEESINKNIQRVIYFF